MRHEVHASFLNAADAAAHVSGEGPDGAAEQEVDLA
jgi:hypothetical protein